MALTEAVKRGTGMPDADVKHNTDLMQKACAGWVVSSVGLGSNATTVSYGTACVIVNGVMNLLTTSTFALSGTLAASTTGAYVYMCGQSGTLRSVVCTGTTLAAIAFAAASANTEVPIGFTRISCTATAFNGGTNSLADSSYVVSHYNLVGPTGLAISTELYTVVPG